MVVLPVAPLYDREFLNDEVKRNFEQRIAEVQAAFPAAQIVRLDQVPALQSDDLFTDPVHLNGAGRDVATAARAGYQLVGLRAFDAFPMTHHVECVATFERQGDGASMS